MLADVASQHGVLLACVVFLYVGVSLTIPLWVPIVKRLTGDCGVFWVSCLTKLPSRPWLELP